MKPETIAGYAYQIKSPICTGCNKEFIDTIRLEESNAGSYCSNCYGSIVGIEEYERMMKSLSELDKLLFTTPVNELSKQIIEGLTFVDKTYKERLLVKAGKQ